MLETRGGITISIVFEEEEEEEDDDTAAPRKGELVRGVTR